MRGVPLAGEAFGAAPLRSRSSEITQRDQHLHHRSVVAEGLAQMGENVKIAGGKDEAGAQLEGILTQFMLTVAGGHSLLAGGEVAPQEEVEEVCLPQVRDLVGEAFFVDQQGEGDLRLLAEEPGVVGVPKTDCGEGCPGFLNLQLMIAQLRDMLAAEDSSIVAQEDEHRGSFFPQGPEANCLAVWIREFNGGEGGGAGGIRHRLVPTTALRE